MIYLDTQTSKHVSLEYLPQTWDMQATRVICREHLHGGGAMVTVKLIYFMKIILLQAW